MSSKNISDKPVGVIGAGSFGSAVANILAVNSKVLLYARNAEVVKTVHETGVLNGVQMHENITMVNDLEQVGKSCDVIFPIVPSENFSELIQQLSPFLKPYHILIHGTKGLWVAREDWQTDDRYKMSRDDVYTISRLIREKSLVVRIGCLAGPNLSRELIERHPAATVVASHFDEVIAEGQRLLRNDRFQVYGSKDLIGIELTGVLKNIIAIGAGALSGMGFGENARSLLISRGLIEMIYLGRMLGANTQAFLGLAGIGDLVATCSSSLSRNFTVGRRLAAGEKIEDILSTMEETAEGINTIKIMIRLMKNYPMRSPITESLNKVISGDMTMEEALKFLMKSPFSVDINFM